jgi:hypothetical protein
MRKIPPNELARTLAGALWPDVQGQERIAPGVYWFSCAGHGGAIAHLPTAGLPDEAVCVAREFGLIELVATVDNGRASRRYTTVTYTSASLRDLAKRAPGAVALHEFWVGEEDCDWATLAISSDAICEGLARGRWKKDTAASARAYAFENAQRWNEPFLARVTPGYVPLPDGQIARAQQRTRILEGGGHIRASTQAGDEAGTVHVTFKGAAGEITYAMSRTTYEAVDLDRVATPATYAEHGAIHQLEGAR